jgi:hypothetical protein
MFLLGMKDASWLALGKMENDLGVNAVSLRSFAKET